MPRPFNNRRGGRGRGHFNKKRGGPRFPHNKPNQSPREYLFQNQLLEGDVGINQFISKLDGFSGVIKARFSDFQVNEIDLEGQIAKLTDQSYPEFVKKVEKIKLEDAVTSRLTDLIPEDTWQSIKQMMTSTDEDATKTVDLKVTHMSKEDRAKIHGCIRSVFGSKVCANTGSHGDEKVMQFKRTSPGDRTADKRTKWPEDKGEYVHFLVYKECLDTMEACLKIADCLNLQASNFNYAGVKDKRAKTTQWFSVRKVEPWRLIRKTKAIRNMRIGNITFKDAPLKLGDLSANKFRIALRNVECEDEKIQRAMEGVKNNGFINYYGLQRFGNDKDKPTYAVGVQLLLGNWEEACNIILKATSSEDKDSEGYKAKTVYTETRDAKKALKQFTDSRNKCVEYLLLSGLSKGHSNDYVNALESIPRNTRLLYLHSLQSLVWNLVVSKRIEKFGLEVVEGDLIPEDESNDKVKALSVDDLSNYTIYDIVLPLPGYDVIYPKHLLDDYKEILGQYSLTIEMTRQKVQTYNLSGNYRKILGQLKDFSWKIMRYNDPNYNLIRSDLEELRGFEEPKSMENGEYKSLIMEFSLVSASYATMVLREVLKMDTSSSYHSKLNNYHGNKDEKSVKITILNSGDEDKSESNDVVEGGLLQDEQKYEEFKSLVFSREGVSKRKFEDEGDVEGAKVVKRVQ